MLRSESIYDQAKREKNEKTKDDVNLYVFSIYSRWFQKIHRDIHLHHFWQKKPLFWVGRLLTKLTLQLGLGCLQLSIQFAPENGWVGKTILSFPFGAFWKAHFQGAFWGEVLVLGRVNTKFFSTDMEKTVLGNSMVNFTSLFFMCWMDESDVFLLGGTQAPG